MTMLSAWDELHAMEDGQQFELYQNSFKKIKTGFFHSHDFYEIYFFVTGNASIYIEEYDYPDDPWYRCHYAAWANAPRSTSQPDCIL